MQFPPPPWGLTSRKSASRSKTSKEPFLTVGVWPWTPTSGALGCSHPLVIWPQWLCLYPCLAQLSRQDDARVWLTSRRRSRLNGSMLPEILRGSQRVLQTSSGQSQPGEAEVFLASDSSEAREQIRARLPAREAAVEADMVKAKARVMLYTGPGVNDTLTPSIAYRRHLQTPCGEETCCSASWHPLGRKTESEWHATSSSSDFSIPAIKENFALKMINNCKSIQQVIH